MCGLIATVNLRLESSVVDELRHRGPDDSGIERFAVGSHTVDLGHRRLAIVDLSPAGHQPMRGPAGSALVYNGEVYNHDALRHRLPATSWRGHSDTETIIAWLESKGCTGLADLNGIFALAWLDSASRRLVLARDPFGVKPLYYAADGGRFVAGSELAPLRSLVASEVDPDSVSLLLRLRYLPAPYTLYRGIRKVRPGHALVVDLSGPVISCREEAFAGDRAPVPEDPGFEEAARRYADLLQQAVERQLMADTEVGVLLSGGLDSAMVARYARDASPGRLKAFTVGFAGQYAENEIAEAATSAQALGIESFARVVTLDDFLGSLQEIARVVEEPLATTSIVPMHFLSALAAEHVKVVLSGQGADEPLGGYARYRGYRLAGAVPVSAVAPLRALANGICLRNEQLYRGLAAAAETDERDRLLAAWQVFTPAEITALTGRADHRSREVLDDALSLWCGDGTGTPVERMMRLDMRLGLADDLLLYTDRVTMRHSLECRVPFLDHDLVRYVLALPLAYKLGWRDGKRIHRRAAASVLPAVVIARRKKGFDVPTSHWFRDSSRLRRMFAEHGAGLGQYVDPAGVERLITEHAAGYNREKQIFLLLMLACTLAH